MVTARQPHVRALVVLLVLAALTATLALRAAPAAARSGGEVRVTASCDRGASASLRLRARDGRIRVRFEVDHHRAGGAWRVVLVRDRRVVWRGTARTRGTGDSFEIERGLRDLVGADRVSVRASGPRGLTCTAAATLTG